MTPFDRASGTAGTGHADRLGTEQYQHLVDQARAAADLLALEVFELGHRILGMEQAGAVGVHADQVNVLELIHGVFFDITLEGAGRGLAGRHHERGFKDFGFGGNGRACSRARSR